MLARHNYLAVIWVVLAHTFTAFTNSTYIPVKAEIVTVQPAKDDTEQSEYGIGHGLSKRDFIGRQRYLENSGFKNACSHAVSVASQPLEPKCSSSLELHHFIQEQRKIISTFRAQPWPMQMKLAAIRCYKQNVSKYMPHLNTLDTFRDTSRQVFKRMKRKFKAVCECLTIWGSIIKRIEGHFGTSVASFFTFLRWLCALNLMLTLLVVGLLVIPQILSGHGLEPPLSVRENGSAVSFLLDGKGYIFEYSALFYGYYDSGQGEPHWPPPANPQPYIGLFYRLPLAYLLVIFALFVLCVVALLSNMAEKYKLLQRANASEQYPFSWKLFASWDYAITNANTAASKKRYLSVSLKETIVEQAKQENSQINVKLWLVRLLTNTLVLVCLAGTSYAIFLAVENAENTNADTQRNFQAAIDGGWQGIWSLMLSFQVQMVIIARNLILPCVFSVAEFAEKLHPRTALKMMLVRMFMLYVSSLYVLIIALFTTHKDCQTDSRAEAQQESYCCWETVIGQELFKLSLTHLLADMANIAVMDGVRWILTKASCLGRIVKWIGPAEFSLANNILKLVYGQALLLLGVLFCPLLPAMGFLKNVVLFYCRAFAVLYFNKPPRTLFRVASTRNFYLALLLLTVFLCALPVGYAILQMTPSLNCGPFRGLPSMLDIVLNEITTWPAFLQTIFEYMQTAMVVIPVMALLGIIIYYYAALSHALKEVNKDLSLQLHVEQNETRQRIAREVRPQSMDRRHQELQAAIQTELKVKMATKLVAGKEQGRHSQQPEVRDPHTPQPDSDIPSEREYGGLHTSGRPRARQTAVYVEPPRAPTHSQTVDRHSDW